MVLSGRPIAVLLMLLLWLQGLLGAFLRPPAAATQPLELCAGAGTARLALDADGAPGEVDRPSCLLCLLPTTTGPVDPPDLPLPSPFTRASDPLTDGSVPVVAIPSPAWPRAPPCG